MPVFKILEQPPAPKNKEEENSEVLQSLGGSKGVASNTTAILKGPPNPTRQIPQPQQEAVIPIRIYCRKHGSWCMINSYQVLPAAVMNAMSQCSKLTCKERKVLRNHKEDRWPREPDEEL